MRSLFPGLRNLGKKRLSSRCPHYFFAGLLFIVSCASPSLVEGVDFESKDFLDVLKTALRVDVLFEKRTRCFFLDIKREGESKNLHKDREYSEFERTLIKNGIYQTSDKCENLKWKNIINSPVNWNTFSNSPELVLGVSVSYFNFTKKQLYSGVESSKKFIELMKIVDIYCVKNYCSKSEKEELNFVYIEFAVCDYPGYQLLFIKNRIIDIRNHASYGCLK